MFRPMRRAAQLLPQSESLAILARSTCGTLALLGDDGYPYAVPLSHVYAGGKLYFHCASQGHKLDAIRACDKASFCVIDQDLVVPEKLTTLYRSVIAFGRIRILQQPGEILAALRALGERFAPGHPGIQAEIDESLSHVCVLEMTIDHLTGKEGRELALARRGS